MLAYSWIKALFGDVICGPSQNMRSSLEIHQVDKNWKIRRRFKSSTTHPEDFRKFVISTCTNRPHDTRWNFKTAAFHRTDQNRSSVQSLGPTADVSSFSLYRHLVKSMSSPHPLDHRFSYSKWTVVTDSITYRWSWASPWFWNTWVCTRIGCSENPVIYLSSFSPLTRQY